jgi:hypothetical protein
LTKHDIEREDDGMSKSLIYKMRCGCEFWEGLDYVGEVYSEMQYCAKHDNFPKLRSRIAELEEFKSAYYSLEKDNNKLRDIIINLEEELAQLRNQIKELEARTTWQPIETAPANVKVLLLIHIINGYNISIAHRVILGEIGDQWNTESGTYFHGTSLKMLAGWMPLPSSTRGDGMNKLVIDISQRRQYDLLPKMRNKI